MSLFKLTITLAPIATGGAVTALFALPDLDPRTKTLLRVIAWLSGIATVIGIIVMGPELFDAFFDMQPRIKRLIEELSKLSIETQRALIAAHLTLFVGGVAYLIYAFPHLRAVAIVVVLTIAIAASTYHVSGMLRDIAAQEQVELGHNYRSEKKTELAIAAYSRAIELVPSAENYRQRAHLFSRETMFDKAIEDISQAIRIAPIVADYRLLSRSLWRLERYEEVVLALTKGMELNSSGSEFYQMRGSALAKMGQHTRAISDYSEALKRDGKSACLLYHRGESYASEEMVDKAIEDLAKAVADDDFFCSGPAREALSSLRRKIESKER